MRMIGRVQRMTMRPPQGEEVVFEALVSSSSRLSDYVFHITTEESHTMTETETETTITLIETMSDNAVGEEQGQKQEQEYGDVDWLDYMDDEDYDDGDNNMEEEEYDDDEEEEEGDEEAVRPASEESIMGLEMVRIEEGSVGLAGEDCAVCLDEFSIGSEARRMPCSHIYHQDCIVLWLGTSNLCPMCRYRLP
ncbi:E3 ubiquitin-protein ligase CIP8-like isoform X1 [Quercus lobata]|uniref:E3 ubiquitin-protein ligase CIP8-like isoform X1 n=1 Tax=Quercus lobata TaxID=97700 RepID=UPI0012479979|nr:E3 ubiquitin-protein ligase CIP8-like isoform X1 [Quercus lobata]